MKNKAKDLNYYYKNAYMNILRNLNSQHISYRVYQEIIDDVLALALDNQQRGLSVQEAFGDLEEFCNQISENAVKETMFERCMRLFYIFSIGIFVVFITILVLNFLRSATGRQAITIREDEIAAESMGVNVTKLKVIIFVIGAMISAIAGSLYVSYIGTVVPKDFAIMKSIDYLIIAVLGGLGSITGTIIAAVVLGIINMFLQNVSNLRMIIYALALILVMLFRPGGLLGTKELYLSKFFNKSKEGK